jgi:arylsulfatase A-like enzyme
MCAKVDHLFGQVVAALKEQGMYDDTLILFLSDHGDFASDYSLPEKTHSTLQDALVRTPFIIKPPAGVATQPGIRQHLTELVDMTATIYDLLGIEPGYACQGLSLRESLAGTDTEIHDAVFAEVGSRRGESAFKNLDVLNVPKDSFYGRQSQAALKFHDLGSLAVMCRTQRYKYIRRPYIACNELYDLETDPGETRNLSGDPTCAEIERQLETRLLDFFMQTADVLPHEQDSRQI